MFTITVESSPTRQSFQISTGDSVLVGSEKCLSNLIPVGCRGGGCGVCKVRVVEGDYRSKCMSKAHICDAQAAEGYVLACRVYPLSDMCIELVKR